VDSTKGLLPAKIKRNSHGVAIFSTSRRKFMAENQSPMIPVPLPTEIPSPPQLDQLPLDILHSATVEMLIQQNEDLSSRLKVNIRRNSLLEQKVLQLEKEIQQLHRQKENLLAQNELVKEKEKIWTEKKQEKDLRLQSLLKEIDLLELRYNELHTTSKQKYKEALKQIESQRNRLEALKKKNQMAHKIKERAKDRLREFLIHAAGGMNREHAELKKLTAQVNQLNQQNKQQELKWSQQEDQLKEQIEKLKSSSLKALSLMREENVELKSKNESTKQKLDELNREMDELRVQFFEEKKNRIRLAQISQDLGELKNERIQIKRQLSEQQEKFADSLNMEEARSQELRQRLERSEAQALTQQSALSSCETQILELSKDNQQLSEQLQALQKLWVKAQAELEKEQSRAKALEKINRELSQDLKQDKVSRLVARAHEVAEPMQSNNDERIQSKLSQVYASQYRTVNRPPKMDL
jgi:DNA repair exonuclease SbcCD ATPase subunit